MEAIFGIAITFLFFYVVFRIIKAIFRGVVRGVVYDAEDAKREYYGHANRTLPDPKDSPNALKIEENKIGKKRDHSLLLFAGGAIFLAIIITFCFSNEEPNPTVKPTSESRPAATGERSDHEVGPYSENPARVGKASQPAKPPTSSEEAALGAPVPAAKTPEQRAADLEADTVDNYRTSLDVQCAAMEHQVEQAAKAVAAGAAPEEFLDMWKSQYQSCLLREANAVILYQELLENDAQQCRISHPDWDAYRCMSNDYQNPFSERPPHAENVDQPAVPPNASTDAVTSRPTEITPNSDNKSPSTTEPALPNRPSAPLPTVSSEEGDAVTTCTDDAKATGQRDSSRANSEGLRLLAGGQLEGARSCFRVAVRLHGSNVEALNNLGYVCQLQGKFQESENYLLKVVQLAPDRKVAYCNLGYTEAKLGKHAEAVSYFRTYIKLFHDKEHGKAALERAITDTDPLVQSALKQALSQ
jgi:tetratricopeptide (TPR) repeat protein